MRKRTAVDVEIVYLSMTDSSVRIRMHGYYVRAYHEILSKERVKNFCFLEEWKK